MRTLKKTLALVLCLAMIAGLCCFGTSAAFADAAEIKNTEAVTVMNALGVLKGDGTNFNPKGILTRAEAAVMLAKLLGGGDLKATSSYKDMAGFEWAQNYAAFCENAGLILGDGAGNFFPGQTLTGYQFGLMLCRALGYKPAEEGVQSATYEIGTAALMKKIGLSAAIKDFDGTAGLTRENAAALLLQTLKSDLVVYEGGSTVTINGAVITTGAVRKTVGNAVSDYAARTIGDGTGEDNKMQFVEEYFPKLTLDTTSGDSFKRPANIWTNDTTPVGVFAAPAAHTVYVTEINNTIEKVMYALNTKYTYSGNIVYFNGADTGVSYASYDEEYGDKIEVYMHPTTANTVSKIVVSRYTPDVIIADPDSNVTVADANATPAVSYYTAFSENGATKNTQVPGFDAATYVKNAVVALALDSDDSSTILDSYVIAPTTGKITAVAAGKYTMGGNTYAFSGAGSDNLGTIDFTADYDFYIDKNGDILYAKKSLVSAAAVDLADVYFLAETYFVAAPGYNGDSTYKFYAQLVSTEGVVSTVELAPWNFAGLKKVVAPTGNPSTSSYKEVDVTSSTGYKASEDTSVNPLKTYYEADAALTNGLLYSAKAIADTTYTQLTVYAPAVTSATKLGNTDTTGTLVGIETVVGDFKVNANTKFVLVKGSLTTGFASKVFTGSLNMTLADTTAPVVYTIDANGNAVASYMFIEVASFDQAATAAADLLFCANASVYAQTGAEKFEFTLYKMDGTTVTALCKSSAPANLASGAFVTYSVDQDGFYTFADQADSDLSALGFVSGVASDKYYAGLYNGMISFTGYTDKKVASTVKVIDLRLEATKAADTYKGTINSIDTLQAAYQKGEVLINVYATGANGVEIIFVESVGAYNIAASTGYKFYTNAGCTVEIATDAPVTAGTTVYVKADAANTGIAAASAAVPALTPVVAPASGVYAVSSFRMPNADVTADSYVAP